VLWTNTYEDEQQERMAKRRKSVTLQVRVDPETQQRLIQVAHQWDWSLSQVVREGIRRLLHQSRYPVMMHSVGEKGETYDE
jgi:predicted HicB family RNase H-like nuclease